VTLHRAYVGIGTNLGDRIGNIERALPQLAQIGTVLARSSIYRTRAWGRTDQPWFANAVVLLKTTKSPKALLQALQAAERSLGRTPGERWGPRTIDLDLLLYDDLEIDEPQLRVPHPHLHERAFVVVPLALKSTERARSRTRALSRRRRRSSRAHRAPARRDRDRLRVETRPRKRGIRGLRAGTRAIAQNRHDKGRFGRNFPHQPPGTARRRNI